MASSEYDRCGGYRRASAAPRSGLRRRRAALAILLLGSFLGVLDPFVVTVALPSIGADFDVGLDVTAWVIVGYGTAYASGLVCGARLGDLYGRRRLFTIGAALYAAGSLAAGAAPFAAALIGARAVQGLAAAAMLPQVLSIIRAEFPVEDRPGAFSAYGATIGLGVVCGPAVGGLVLAADLGGWGWRAIFFVSALVALAVVFGATLAVPRSYGQGAGGVDLVGAVLSAVALLALVVPLTRVGALGWPWWSIAAWALGPVLLVGFVAYERHVERRGAVPLVPPRLFGNRRFSRGLGAVFLLYAAGAGAPLVVLLTYHLQEGLGVSALQTGMVFAPLGLGFAVASAVAGRLAVSRGLLVPAIGTGVVVVGLGGTALVGLLPAAHQPWALMPVLLLAGAGQGLATNPLLALVLSAVQDADTGSASGILLATTQIANVVGVAVAGSVLFALLPDRGSTSATASAQAMRPALALFAATTAVVLLVLRALGRRRSAAR